MYNDWLLDQVTVEKAEAMNLVQIDGLGPDPIPFGYINDRWRALMLRMREGDELRHFRSPPKSWQDMHGRAGIALVRNGKVIDHIVTELN